ncbi:MAG: DeoR/GlpR transcriptional regulator [Clostridia bacterium]|nr:DeoR/GlpR transcriptional regulator [Clostridia bacterium]
MNQERKRQILEIILKEKKVNVKELSKRLFISEPSIRRDLAELEKEKLLRRVHGGAILEEHSDSYIKIPFIIREFEFYDAKNIIAKKAADLVKDGDVIMLDASSSAYAMIPFLADKSNITVITSGVKSLIRLAEYGINTYSTGGRLLPSCLSMIDSDAQDTISNYNADIVFFSCRGLSEDGIATDFSIEENLVRQKMIAQSKRAVLLCAGEKYGKKYMHNLCKVKDIDCVVSEIELQFS